ncbi:DUF2829 domain-containing protein [Xenorhabdus anantnagensis]|uniref:DUF2829 domain-containing protein n=1 Tax=Xenorhabdus anantnagensis TaxID=3025875 RepID=A0ABT5LX71_9GAMM|nr:DUF2829 domain-containing protein [Xenorhabdus anantnagensis]MDC9598323.1 DUF2829 domain-containing protein [Xenorhabdus anantnagensis]
MATFSEALEAVKAGKFIHRAGWNGANQFIARIYAGNAAYRKGAIIADMQDCLGLKNTQGTMQPGWAPSQGDLFAEDWVIQE